MKYTIEGFSQKYAMTLKKEVDVRGKTVTRKIDCTDLVILRWFVDFYPNMKKMEINGKQYAWLTHNKLKEDLPLIDITKRAFSERMQKMVDFGILSYKLIKEGGTFSLYGFGENYKHLIDDKGMRSNDRGVQETDTEGVRSNDIGVGVQTANKDTSISDTSIKDIKKKESKSNSFDLIIKTYTSDEKTISLLQEWLKVRKAKRAALTDKAIEMNIAKLDKLSTESNMSVNEYLEEVICRGWAAFYPINNFKQKQSKQPERANNSFDYLNGSIITL